MLGKAAIITSRREELIKDEKIETTFAAVNRKEECVRQVVDEVLGAKMPQFAFIIPQSS